MKDLLTAFLLVITCSSVRSDWIMTDWAQTVNPPTPGYMTKASNGITGVPAERALLHDGVLATHLKPSPWSRESFNYNSYQHNLQEELSPFFQDSGSPLSGTMTLEAVLPMGPGYVLIGKNDDTDATHWYLSFLDALFRREIFEDDGKRTVRSFNLESLANSNTVLSSIVGVYDYNYESKDGIILGFDDNDNAMFNGSVSLLTIGSTSDSGWWWQHDYLDLDNALSPLQGGAQTSGGSENLIVHRLFRFDVEYEALSDKALIWAVASVGVDDLGLSLLFWDVDSNDNTALQWNQRFEAPDAVATQHIVIGTFCDDGSDFIWCVRHYDHATKESGTAMTFVSWVFAKTPTSGDALVDMKTWIVGGGVEDHFQYSDAFAFAEGDLQNARLTVSYHDIYYFDNTPGSFTLKLRDGKAYYENNDPECDTRQKADGCRLHDNTVIYDRNLGFADALDTNQEGYVGFQVCGIDACHYLIHEKKDHSHP